MSKKAKNNNSIPELLRSLWRDGFFTESKELSEISGGLAANGHNFPVASLGVALMRAVRPGGFLSRVKTAGKWEYIQKHPITSVTGQRTDLFAQIMGSVPIKFPP
jgi:hypothetical protein